MKDSDNDAITMWAAQTQIVLDTIERDGVSYVKREYIDKKYGEVAWIFKTAYNFFIPRFQVKVEKPAQAESPVWLYRDPKWGGNNSGVVFMKLEIPADQIVFFDLRKWSEVLNLDFIGTEQEKKVFENELKSQGIYDAMEIFTKPFYPMLKRKVMKSWEKIFDIEGTEEQYLQGAVWCLKKEWICEIVKD